MKPPPFAITETEIKATLTVLRLQSWSKEYPDYKIIISLYHLLTENEVITEKSQTRPRSEISL